jgi:hypothetical protein
MGRGQRRRVSPGRDEPQIPGRTQTIDQHVMTHSEGRVAAVALMAAQGHLVISGSVDAVTEVLPASRRSSRSTLRGSPFWLVSALTEIGELDRARALCEKLLSYATPLFLYAEEIDPHSGRHLGNFPQAFSHLALINAVMHLIRADEQLSAEAMGSSGSGDEL